MIVKEFGIGNSEVIVLLHGGGLSWWNYRDEAEILKDRYHVVIPILDGHSGSDSSFTSIERNASELIRYIDLSFGGHVLAIGGLSLGGQILVEMLVQRGDICSFALIESALVIPMKLTKMTISTPVTTTSTTRRPMLPISTPSPRPPCCRLPGAMR